MENTKASLKDRLIFLFTGRIRNYARYANEDVMRAHLKLITNEKSISYKNRYSKWSKEEKIAVMNFLATTKPNKEELKEFIEAFPKHKTSRRPYFI